LLALRPGAEIICGVLASSISTESSRQEAYKADVVIGIILEFGFVFAGQHGPNDPECRTTGAHYAIVDEVDSVLIDEARTPHIISAPDEVPTNKYYEYAKVIDKYSAEY